MLWTAEDDKLNISSNNSTGMPYKYPQEHGWNVPKQKYKLKNWSQYSNALKNRGRIDLWLDKEAIDNWYEEDQENVGTCITSTIISGLRLLYLPVFRKNFFKSFYSLPSLQFFSYFVQFPFDSLEH